MVDKVAGKINGSWAQESLVYASMVCNEPTQEKSINRTPINKGPIRLFAPSTNARTGSVEYESAWSRKAI